MKYAAININPDYPVVIQVHGTEIGLIGKDAEELWGALESLRCGVVEAIQSLKPTDEELNTTDLVGWLIENKCRVPKVLQDEADVIFLRYPDWYRNRGRLTIDIPFKLGDE